MRTKRLFERTIEFSFLAACLMVTAFIFLSSYETTFSKDVKYVNTIEPVNINLLASSLSSQNENESVYVGTKAEFIGNFGIPNYLKIPKIESKVQLTGAIESQDGHWLGRSNSGHYLFFSKNKNGNFGNMLIYIRKSWRTIANISPLNSGDNIFIDTLDDWRYMYRIDEIKSVSADDPYVASESSEPILVLVMHEDGNQVNYVVKANFVNVQYIR